MSTSPPPAPRPSPARHLPRVAAVLLVGAVIAAGVSSAFHPERRLPTAERVRRANDVICKAPSLADACAAEARKDRPLAVETYARARDAIARARELAEARRVDDARHLLRGAVRDADRLARGRRFIEQHAATKLYESALATVAARRDVFDDAFVASLFRDVTLPDGRIALWLDTHRVDRSALDALDEAPPAARAALAHVVPISVAAHADRRVHMADRVAAGDLDGCVRAARSGFWPPIGTVSRSYDEVLCEPMTRFTKVAMRVTAERDRARARVRDLR